MGKENFHLDKYGNSLRIGDRVAFKEGYYEGYGTIVAYTEKRNVFTIRLAQELRGSYGFTICRAGHAINKQPRNCIKLGEHFDKMLDMGCFVWDAEEKAE